MKVKDLNFAIMLVFPFFFLSCEKNGMEDTPDVHDYRVNDVLYEKDSKLKRVYSVYDDNSRILRVEYLYDDLGRISRKNYGSDIFAYEMCQYNTNGQLEKISSYAVSLENLSVLTKTIVYSYDVKGNKVKDLTEFTDERETIYNLYQYIDAKLIKQEHYEGTQQTFYIVFEYKDDQPVTEKFYVPEEDDFVTTDHLYDQNLLVYSLTYSGNSKSGFMRDEKNYYDRNDNLIKVVSNNPGLSSMAGATTFLVTTEYEYE